MSDDSTKIQDVLSQAAITIIDKVLALEGLHLHLDKPHIVNDVLAIIKEVITDEASQIQTK